MKNLVIILLFLAGAFLVFRRCAPSRAGDVAFTSEWTVERGAMGETQSTDVRLTTDGNRFRLEERQRSLDGEFLNVTVYDGSSLHVRSEVLSESESQRRGRESDGLPFPAPTLDSRPVTEQDVSPLRFWTRSYEGDAGPGGRVAGRETVLYQARSKLPTETRTVQAWVDEKTGVPLKTRISAYSKQVESEVFSESSECLRIQYGDVDPAAFAKP